VIKQRVIKSKPLVATYRNDVQQYRKVQIPLEGWTITLNIVREREVSPKGYVTYIAVLTTGETEVGTHIAMMDREFKFPEGYENVVSAIRMDMRSSGALQRLLEDAREEMRELQRKSVYGALLPN
jgi:hypothetical protein